MRQVLNAFIRPGDESGYVAECPEVRAVTQGADLDEVVANLREAVALAIEGEDLGAMGLAAQPTLVVTLEVQPAAA